MKPYELFKQWSQFEAMLASPSMSDEEKLQMGAEWVSALPPPQLCVSSTLSRVAVENAMRGRLRELKEMIYGRAVTEAPKEEGKQAGKESTQSTKRTREKPVRSNAGKS